MTSQERRLMFGYTTVAQAQNLLEHAVRFFERTGFAKSVSDALIATMEAAEAISRLREGGAE